MVRARKVVLLGLAVVLALSIVAVVGCGGGTTAADKDALSKALDKVDTDITALTTQFTAGGTVTDLKAALAAVQPDWQAVIDAAKKVKGADVAAAEKVWTDVQTAVSGLADTTPLVQAAAAIMGPINALVQVKTDLRKLAPSTTPSS